MTDQMSNDNLMTMVLVGLVVYMMLNKKKSCGCRENFTTIWNNCYGTVTNMGSEIDCEKCNGEEITTMDGQNCGSLCGNNCSIGQK